MQTWLAVTPENAAPGVQCVSGCGPRLHLPLKRAGGFEGGGFPPPPEGRLSHAIPSWSASSPSTLLLLEPPCESKYCCAS